MTTVASFYLVFNLINIESNFKLTVGKIKFKPVNF